MKSKINLESIRAKVNLDQLGQEIMARAEKGEFKPQSPIAALLDTIRPALLKARENKATFSALARYLNEKQIPISEASLRKYLQASGEKTRTKKTVTVVSKASPKSENLSASLNAGSALRTEPNRPNPPPSATKKSETLF